MCCAHTHTHTHTQRERETETNTQTPHVQASALEQLHHVMLTTAADKSKTVRVRVRDMV